MSQNKLTLRYSKSLLGLSIESGCLDGTAGDMMLIQSVFSQNKDFQIFLKSPVIKTDKKETVLNKIFQGKLNELTLAFIRIITIKKREMFLEGITESFIEQYKRYKKIETATITTAVEIDEEIREKILSYIRDNTSETIKKIELHEKVDNNIIGGIIIRMRDKQLDTSISKTIKSLKQTFSKNLYIKDY